MAGGIQKAEGALKTISEVSEQFGIPQHILRYWESRFPQLRPLQRAGNRRYYRTDDVALVARINSLLNHEGYTIKGVQKLLSERSGGAHDAVATPPAATPATPPMSEKVLSELRAIRQSLAAALQTDIAA